MKSILIFDTPTRCYDCPLFTSIDEGEYGFCDDRNILKQKEAQEKIRFDSKPKWCPLSHPLKRVSNDFYIYDRKLPHEMTWGHTADYCEGYNACLEEILGETE